MSRTPQPSDGRGSLKWIQKAVNEQWRSLNDPIVAAIPNPGPITWLSPLKTDDFAEYRDEDFLKLLERSDLAGAQRGHGCRVPGNGTRWAERTAATCFWSKPRRTWGSCARRAPPPRRALACRTS